MKFLSIVLSAYFIRFKKVLVKKREIETVRTPLPNVLMSTANEITLRSKVKMCLFDRRKSSSLILTMKRAKKALFFLSLGLY